jgi:nucleotide-binding universal stress UspA family protein
MYRKILIATDGSETAQRAVKIGAQLVRDAEGEAVLLHVGDEVRGQAVLADARNEIPSARAISVDGAAADKIIEIAEKENADLIVIGNKGMTGAKRFLLGSVPNQVSHHAPCDVFIVKTT